MVRALLLFLFLFPLQSHALVYFGGYGQVGFGDLKENVETISASQSLTHDGWTGHIGFGGRAGLSVSLVTAGVIGDYAKVQWEGERQDATSLAVLMVRKITTMSLKGQWLAGLSWSIFPSFPFTFSVNIIQK